MHEFVATFEGESSSSSSVLLAVAVCEVDTRASTSPAGVKEMETEGILLVTFRLFQRHTHTHTRTYTPSAMNNDKVGKKRE